MSLLVWLPLINDTHNQGANPIELSSSGTITYTTGKIGNAATFSSARLANTITLPTSPISACCWVYLNTDITSLQYMISLNATTGFADHAIGLAIESSKINYVIGGNSTVQVTPTLNTWMHVAVTYDGSTIRGYLNGVQIGSKSGVTQLSGKTRLTIGARYNNNNSYTGYLKGKLNDVRIYDHCLSAAEVHEISQGLVLHYKLDDIPQNYSKNNNTAWTNFTIGQYYTTLFSYSMTDFLAVTGAKNGDKFTWSVDIKGTGGTKPLCARVQHYNSSSNRTSVVGPAIPAGEEGRSAITFTVNTSYNQLDFMITNGNASGVTNNTTEQYKNTKIQAGDIATEWLPTGMSQTITDSSGYGHNGTIVGNLNLINNTPRYSAATNFNGSSAIKYTSFNLGNIWSAGMWFYSSSSVTTGWGALFTVNTSGGDADLKMNLYLQQTSGRIQYSANGQYDSSPTFTKDIWHHLMETFDGATLSCYLDGALIKTKAITNAEFTRSNLYVGARSSATNGSSASNYVNAYISDFRIYCTALSAADAKQLYELGAKVDNKGNLHCYELKEYSTLPKFHKNGIVQHKILYETGLLNNITSFSYKPAANTNNSCTNGAILDFTAFANEGQSVTFSIEYDVSWSGLSAGTGGTFRTLIQGSNRLKSNNSWAWQGSNYFTGFNFTSSVTSNATGSIHKIATVTIPASWFDTYNGSYFGFRTDYANGTGTVSISNLKVTVQSNIFKLKKSSIMTNNLIEF